MDKDCSEVVKIITEWFDDIDEVKRIWEHIANLNPEFEQASEENWRKKEASLWLHGETRTFEAVEFEKWLMINAPIANMAITPVMGHLFQWKEHLREVGIYAEFSESDILPPLKNESLIDYVLRMAQTIENRGWGNKKQKRAAKSFLHFLREKHEKGCAFIEHIIPEKNDLRAGKIIRIIRPQVYPISQEIAGAIVKEVANQCINGRANAQHHACEVFTLILMCVTSSRIRWPRTLESVHELPKKGLIIKKESAKLSIPSIFGPHRIQISNRVTKLITAISKIPSKTARKTILQTPLPDLRKTLRSVINKVNPPPEVGEITFLTFLSHPHYFGENIR